MQDISITMNQDGSFSFDESVSAGYIEEYKAKRLKIKVNSVFQSSDISYFTLSFEPLGACRKIVSKNIYKSSQYNDGDMFYSLGYIYCPIYDYMASSPCVSVQIDGYETDASGDIASIVKSGIFELNFSQSLMGECFEAETARTDLKLSERINDAVEDNFNSLTFSGEKLLDATVDTSKLKSLSVTAQKLADNSVTENKISSGAVTTEKINDASVSSEKIQNGSVTSEKISSSAVTSACIADNAVKTEKLENFSVTALKLSDKCVTSDKLSANCVTAEKLSPGAVTSSAFSTGSVTSGKLADKSVSSSKICDGAVTPEKLDRAYLTQHQDVSSKAEKTEIPTSLSDLENDKAVSFAESQSLTENQKALARKNIGAVKDGSFYAPSSLGESGELLTADGSGFKWISTDDSPEENSPNPVKSSGVYSALQEKVDKIEGKGLSENDFTDGEKSLLHSALQEHQSLESYATKDWVEGKNYITSHQDISGKADVSSLSAVSFSGSYNDLSDKPEIPDKFTDAMKMEYDTAYLHSQTSHAPADAQKNIIEAISVNEEACEISNKTVNISALIFRKENEIFMEVIQ